MDGGQTPSKEAEKYGNVPSNLTGTNIAALRLRSGSLRRRGYSKYNEFSIPKGVVGYVYLSNVVGLLVYNASDVYAKELQELDVRVSGYPFVVKFKDLKDDLPHGSLPKCVFFDLFGGVEFEKLVNGSVCVSVNQVGKMRNAAESGVPLAVAAVGRAKVPVAMGTRTKPILENEFTTSEIGFSVVGIKKPKAKWSPHQKLQQTCDTYFLNLPSPSTNWVDAVDGRMMGTGRQLQKSKRKPVSLKRVEVDVKSGTPVVYSKYAGIGVELNGAKRLNNYSQSADDAAPSRVSRSDTNCGRTGVNMEGNNIPFGSSVATDHTQSLRQVLGIFWERELSPWRLAIAYSHASEFVKLVHLCLWFEVLIADAEENLGESEKALEQLKVTEGNTVAVGQRIDLSGTPVVYSKYAGIEVELNGAKRLNNYSQSADDAAPSRVSRSDTNCGRTSTDSQGVNMEGNNIPFGSSVATDYTQSLRQAYPSALTTVSKIQMHIPADSVVFSKGARKDKVTTFVP
ncbi:hypothetical protein CTI12_AA418540 [Artemisia annua]|uniref:Uncharacterized protein n=1 Tax=Artemisia annua TaxID=35608 RepID=A0A2U1M5F1_ARTAN|nr:hypothetical protein CTI12_AA418540 [Artemisia annua]